MHAKDRSDDASLALVHGCFLLDILVTLAGPVISGISVDPIDPIDPMLSVLSVFSILCFFVLFIRIRHII